MNQKSNKSIRYPSLNLIQQKKYSNRQLTIIVTKLYDAYIIFDEHMYPLNL